MQELPPDAGEIRKNIQRKTGGALGELAKVWRVKIDGAQLIELLAGSLENPHHLVGADPSGQGNGE